ncbi:Uncharacterized conserved protein [Phaffia rhodozyma]|uniref:Uncharacterized conserved protein n=1 Tax=Phaffia rhodozyma TaxID=264483 RepID=A0A0F7SLW2_PHARH|nr:Uncharacterized conserved protein [Phaffia rhodozyma]
MSLAEAAQSRKERLDALRKRKAGGSSSADGLVQIKQRNFDPETRSAKKFSTADLPETIESAISGVAEQIVAEDELRRQEELNLLNIAPKRPNWDLKRDLDRINLKLKPATDEAIKSIIRERLGGSSKDTSKPIDLVSALDALGDMDDEDEIDGAKSDDE